MVVQWDPLRQFRPIQAEAVDELRGPHPIVEAGLLTYDVYLRGDELLIEFDVPGVGPSDLEVTLEDRTLVVRANRAPVPARGVDVIDSGRQHGSFCRRLFLGDRWDPATLRASMHYGVLTVRADVRAAAPSKHVVVVDRESVLEFGAVREFGGGERLSAELAGEKRMARGSKHVPIAELHTKK